MIFIFFAFANAHAGKTAESSLRSAAEFISYMSNGPCKNMSADNVAALQRAASKQSCASANSLSNAGKDAKELYSEVFFEMGQKAYAELLQCEYDKIKNFSFENPKFVYELASRSEAIKELSTKTKSMTGQWQLLNSKIPKSGHLPLTPYQKDIKKKADALNNDIKNLEDQKNMILASLPFGQRPDMLSFLETTDFKTISPGSLTIRLRGLRATMVDEIQAAKKIAQSPNPLPAVVKENIVQDPAMMDYIFKKSNLKKEDHSSLLCYLDAVYGEGAKKRDLAITVGATIAGLGAGSLLTRVALVAWRSGRISVAAWNLAQKTAAATAAVSGTIISIADTARLAETECKDAPSFKMKGPATEGDQCSSTSLEREIEEGNCFLGTVLPAIGASLSFHLNPRELRGLQSLITRYKEKKEVKAWLKTRTPQTHFQKMIAMREKGNVAEATRYEQKLKSYMEANEVVDRKRVGSGISEARYVEFPDGTVGIWKKAELTVSRKDTHAAAAELAAYKLDNYLGYNRVPITVSKKLNGVDGTVQLLVDNLGTFSKGRGQEELSVFDYLIHNFDRTNNPANLLYTSEGHAVAIDHGFAFNKKWPKPPDGSISFVKEQAKTTAFDAPENSTNLFNLNAAQSQRDQRLISIVGDQKAYEKLKSTTDEKWRELFSGNLSTDEIDLFLKRRQNVIDSVEQARARFGDSIFSGLYSPIRLPE
tara:strand:+ start:7864 stop:9987 length:2124 start_codon:yes stop_codon:yes gene_type:complete